MSTEPHASSRHAGEPHARSENDRLNRLRAGVLGANDGIVSVSAMLLGMVGAGTSTGVILTAGLASTIAGAVSMGLGEYVSVSAQRDTERVLIHKESDELHAMPDEERDELADILQGYGISPQTAAQAAREISDGDPLPAHLRLELGAGHRRPGEPVVGGRFLGTVVRPRCRAADAVGAAVHRGGAGVRPHRRDPRGAGLHRLRVGETGGHVDAAFLPAARHRRGGGPGGDLRGRLPVRRLRLTGLTGKDS
jgi:hypothetical protein